MDLITALLIVLIILMLFRGAGLLFTIFVVILAMYLVPKIRSRGRGYEIL